MKRILSILLISILLISSAFSVSTAATQHPKQEDVYAVLDYDGSVKDVYIVNSFTQGSIVDYGDYTNLKNLSSKDSISYQNGMVEINSNQDSVYYQGTKNDKTLPWNIAIKYYLDGKETDALSLSGKSGSIQIDLSISPNKDADSFFYKNYTVSTEVTLDSKTASNIRSEGAIIANAGSNKLLTYTTLPNTTADISIYFDAVDFEMQSISISAIKMSMDLDFDISNITGRFDELTDAVKKLDDGALDLLNGITEFRDGLVEYVEGRNAFHQGIVQLSDGISQLGQGAQALSQGLNAISSQGAPLNEGMKAIEYSTFQQVNQQLAQMQLPIPELTRENYTEILEHMPQLEQVKQQLDGITALTDGIAQYTGGVSQLSGGAQQLASGINTLNGSTKQLIEYSAQLNDAATQLKDAAKEIQDGLREYKDGTNEFLNETSGIADKIDQEIEDILTDTFGSDEGYKSFASDKNDNVEALQFAFRTEKIGNDNDNGSAPPAKAVLTFWQKLLKLFGLYNPDK